MVSAFLDNTTIILPVTYPVSDHAALMGHGVTLNYDDATDELQIHFAPGEHHRHTDPINSYLSLLVNTDTEESFGFMVESFLTYAVHEFPQLQPIARYMQLGERPYRDPNMYRQDAPPRTSFPDIAWKRAAHNAIQHIIENTGGVIQT